MCTRMFVRTVWSSSSSACLCTHASVFSSCMYGMSEDGSTSSTSSTVASMLIRWLGLGFGFGCGVGFGFGFGFGFGLG